MVTLKRFIAVILLPINITILAIGMVLCVVYVILELIQENGIKGFIEMSEITQEVVIEAIQTILKNGERKV